MITFKNEEQRNRKQFMFCGDDTVCLIGGRHVLIAGNKTKTLVNKIINKPQKNAALTNIIKLFHCITEYDGVRVIMKYSKHLISKVVPEVYYVCYPFSEAPSKKLITVYKKSTEREESCDKDLRESNAVNSLQPVSA